MKKKPPRVKQGKGLTRVSNLPKDDRPHPNCEECPLRTQGHVPPLWGKELDSEILFVGEAPGQEETEQGRAFVGSAGKVLNMGIDRAFGVSDIHEAYRARVNTVACRPPGNRTPSPIEVALCRPVLERQVKASTTRVIVTLGATAMHSVTGLLEHKRQNRQDAYVGIKGWRGYVVEREDTPREFVVGPTHGVVGHYKTSKRAPNWKKLVEQGYDKDDPVTWAYRKGDPRYGKVPLNLARMEWGPRVRYVMPTLHPSYVMRGFKEMPAFVADLNKAHRLAFGEKPITSEPTVAYDVMGMRIKGWNPETLPPNTLVAFDIETYQLEPAKGSVECISFSWAEDQAVTLKWDHAAREITQAILGRKDLWAVGHNIVGFDVPHLVANGINVEAGLHDTLIMGQMVNPDMPKSLNFVASLTMLIKRWKHLGKVRPEYYNALDSERDLRLWHIQHKELKETGQWDHYANVVQPSLGTLAEFTRYGVRIHSENYELWHAKLGRRFMRLGKLWGSLWPTVNPSSHQQLTQVFGTLLGHPVDSVDKHLLGKLKKPSKKWPRGLREARILSRYRKVERLISYYSSPKYYYRDRSVTGTLRLHPNYVPLSKDDESRESKILTATGRRATKGPNIQNWPSYARHIVIADEGMVFFEADYSQIEAWLTAIECMDPVMLDVLYSGDKLHNWALDQLREVDPAVSYHTAKRVVHGTNYLMGWSTMQQTLHDDEVYVDAATVKLFINVLRERLEGRTRWHHDVIEEAKMRGYLANAFGRRRKFHNKASGELEGAAAAVAFRPASNMADIMWHNLRDLPLVLSKYGARLLGDNHDSLYGQIPQGERGHDALRALIKVMERPYPQITGTEWAWFCPVEVKVGPNWKDLETLELEL